MPVITISRGSYIGAKTLANAVARVEQVPCISREDLLEQAGTTGVSSEMMERALNKPPTFLERFSKEKEVYLAVLRSLLYDHAAQGSFVYHGNSGQLLLGELPNLLRVRVVAPMDFRVAAVMEARRGMTRRRAEMYVKKIDRERDKWIRFIYGVNMDEALLYDLTLNLENVTIDEACDLVCQLASQERFQPSDEITKRVADVALAKRVTAALAIRGDLFSAEVQITADTGVVTIEGTTRFREVREEIQRVVVELPNVAELRNRIRIPSDIFKAVQE